MRYTNDDNLIKEWEVRWNDARHSEKISILGKHMFKAKNKALRHIFTTLQVDDILEVGCGLGYTMAIYRDFGINCTGIDISSDAVNYCQKQGLTVFQKKLEDVEEKYDLVSSDGMLEHFLNFEPFANHMMRISSRYVLLIQPNHDSFVGKTLVYIAELLRGEVNVYEYNYRMKDFISVFERNDFQIIRNIPVFFDVFRILLFKRKNSK